MNTPNNSSGADRASAPKVGRKSGTLRKILTRLLIFFIVLGLLIGSLYYYNLAVVDDPNILNENAALTPDNINLNSSISGSSRSFIDNPYFSEPRTYTINLKDRRRFLKVTFFLGMDDPRVLPYLSRRMPIIDDIIISTIQYKTAEDLQDILGIERLKSELLSKINNEVFTSSFSSSLGVNDKKPVQKILITEFILQ